jgi:peptide chain release factor subunit 1
VMEEFFQELHDGDLATYGFDRTRQNLVMGSVDRLLISEDLRQDVVTYECSEGHEERELIDSGETTPTHTCSRCGEDVAGGEREDAIDHLMGIANQRGTETVFVSTDFEKGEQLLTAFGGVAGLLRYSTNV